MPGTETPPAPPLMKTLIPAEFHDRPYLKDWLDKPASPEIHAEVFKKLDGAESLIGRKIGIPADDAKPEEIEKFYATLRPAKPEDYDFKFGEKADPEFVKSMRAAAHAAGISKAQFNKNLEALVPFFAAREKALAEAQTKRDQEFDALIKSTLGEGHDKKLRVVMNAAKELVPEPFKQYGDKMDEKSVVLFVAFAHAVLAKYASEADLAGLGKEAGGDKGAETREALLEEAHKIYADPAWRNFQDPKHASLLAREKEIFAHPVFKS